MRGKVIYIVFSATPLKMGSMIRAITRGRFNHVSLSFDHELKTLYSFARYHKCAPFYGGFVEESSARYKNKNKLAKVVICAVPVSSEQYDAIKERIEDMKIDPEQYKYNMFSAACAPLSKRVLIPGCYTCIEFVASILSMIFCDIDESEYYTIDDIRKRLLRYVVYTGVFPHTNFESDERYEKKISLRRAAYLSARAEVRLLSDFVNRNKK